MKKKVEKCLRRFLFNKRKKHKILKSQFFQVSFPLCVDVPYVLSENKMKRPERKKIPEN